MIRRALVILSVLISASASGGTNPTPVAAPAPGLEPVGGQVVEAGPLDQKIDPALRTSLALAGVSGRTLGVLPDVLAEEIRLADLPSVLERRVEGGYVVPVTVRATDGDVEGARLAIESVGGSCSTVAAGRVVARVPAEAIEELATYSSVEFVAGSPWRTLLMDASRPEMKVDAVHAGTGLAQPFKGKGVVVGIVDSGIDWTHADFKDASGKSRILFIWDMSREGKPPAGFNHGYEYTKADVDAGLCPEIDGKESGGHGTHVAGIAAGNGAARGAPTRASRPRPTSSS